MLIQNIAKPVIRSYKFIEEAILKHSFAIGSWKYYYEDFKHLKAAITEEIGHFSISKWPNHTLEQANPTDFRYHYSFYSVPRVARETYLVSRPRLVELLEKESCLSGIEQNFQFVVECENLLIEKFKSELKKVLLSSDLIDMGFISLYASMIKSKEKCILSTNLFEQLFSGKLAVNIAYQGTEGRVITPKRIWELLRSDSEYLACFNLDIRARLALRFANYMMDNQHLPPFYDHFRSCNICRLDASVFLKEYLPGVASGKCAEKLKTWELLVLELCDLEQCPTYFAGCDNQGLGEGLQLVRAFHTSSLKSH